MSEVAKKVEEARRRADLNYLLYLNEKAAEEVELLQRASRCGSLCGVALAVKDNIEVAGMPVTNGAPYMRRIADKTAAVIRRLMAEGAVVLGKTNMHELALGATNVNPHFGLPGTPTTPPA
jgi:Asp-tRNAAsn/Glu-tRNAGln amidotransferase A subunit and related amidases